ncbi:MAG: Tyrosine--tRNA ligase [Myxococcota bacterium]|nr:Tyrosine--tRNA ligase [Myxococcota bacterium]
MSFPPVEEQMELLLRGTTHVQVEQELCERLKESREQNRPLRVKAGFDPTAPDLHVGHVVLLQKMRQFQDLGHQVIFLIGDFTGRIGDPTGRSETRRQLTEEEVAANAETYRQQVFKVLDPARTTVDFNSRWMNAMKPPEMVRLAACYSVARMLERDDFKKRFRDGQSISIHEFLYPLVQAYDSVALQADVELGGNDQLFNLLMGRTVQKEYGQRPQIVLTTPLLIGTGGRMADGVITGDKMSKSLGNYIGINEEPDQIFGKTMSISDELMWEYFVLLSRRSLAEIEEMKQSVARGANPRDFKAALAGELVSRFHGEAAGKAARERFDNLFRQKQAPSDMPVVRAAATPDGVLLARLLKDAGLTESAGEARRMFQQGAVRINGEKAANENLRLAPGEYVVQVGKRRWAKIVVEQDPPESRAAPGREPPDG